MYRATIIVLIFCAYSSVAVEIGLKPLISDVQQALTQLLPVMSYGEKTISEIVKYQNGDNIDVKGEVRLLPNTTKFLVSYLDDIRSDFVDFFQLIIKDISNSSVSAPKVDIGYSQLMPYLDAYQTISKEITEINKSIQVFKNIILYYVIPEFNMSSSTRIGLYLSTNIANTYFKDIVALRTSVTNVADGLLKAASDSQSNAGSSSSLGIGGVIMNALNNFMTQLGTSLKIFAVRVKSFGDEKALAHISDNTDYFNVRRTLTRLNVAFSNMNKVLHKSSTSFKTFNFFLSNFMK